ncbi:MAG: zraS 5 [Chitinophagaceae bacterium]|nr:zraS 5 [Chitinophagaceae bacterium]
MPRTENIEQENVLRWRFDVNTFRLLGRELITDRVTAVFELVKNSYDANATDVTVSFLNINSKENDKKIVIGDNGIGMSFADIKNKWMVVGTNSKRTSLYSDPPFNRKFVGEKGIGRFAVDKLGERVLIRTKQRGEAKWLNVQINWDEYEKQANASIQSSQLSLFTEVDNYFFYEDGDKNEQGTQLIISRISEKWTENDIERLDKELSKLVSPYYPVTPPFDIHIESNDFIRFIRKDVKPDAIKFFSHKGEGNFDLEKEKQEVLRFDTKAGKLYTDWEDIKSFGPVKFKVFFFNEAAKRKYNAAYKNDESRIDGIKIYRDGLITTPFAEYQEHRDYKRDILGIDKRLWRDIFFRISTREVIGVLDITKELNPRIIEATNRQDFVDNKEYRDLKEFILNQLEVFSDVKRFQSQNIRSETERELQKAGLEVKNFEQVIEKIEKEMVIDRPDLKNIFDPLKERAIELKTAITQSISEQKKFQKEVIRKENIYHSLMSLQDYATNISHAIRTSLGKIKRQAEFFKINFPNPKYDELFKQYAVIINDEMDVLIQVTDFMLSYARSDINFEDFNVKDVMEKLLLHTYSDTFAAEKISAIVEISDDFIVNANKRFFEDIFLNLISNSIKALKQTQDKIIKCSGYLADDNFTLYFSDNGYGINQGDEKWIFGIYNTRTAEQGGAGLGLYIVQKRVEALKGTVEVTESEFSPGATFRIQLPFNRN